MPYKNKYANMIKGSQIKKRGQLYEKIFRGGCVDQGAHCLRIEDGARALRIPLPQSIVAKYKGRLIGQVIRQKQPFDFIINFKGKIIACDVKTTDKSRLPFSYLNKMIKQHQMLSLLQLRSGCLSGIVMFFVETRKCVFFDINTIYNLEPRKSLTEKDGVLLGLENDFDLKLLFKQDD